MAVVAGGLVLVLAGSLAATALTRRPSRVPGTGWDDQARAALKPVADGLAPLAHDIATWQETGSPSGPVLLTELTSAGATFAGAQAAVIGLPPSPAGHLVNDLYLRSVVLDELWLQVTEAAVNRPPGPAATQLVLSGTRIRELGDRVFDRGHALLTPLLPPTTVTGIDVVRPADVPDWAAEGLAAGPPLALIPSPTGGGQPSVRAATRPTQPGPDWVASVNGAHLPAPSEITSAVSAGDRSRLLGLADELEGATARLFAGPDPAGDREGAARLYLGLLIDAEAARLGTVTDPSLTAQARRLLAVADGLTAAGLAPRRSGLPPQTLVAAA